MEAAQRIGLLFIARVLLLGHLGRDATLAALVTIGIARGNSKSTVTDCSNSRRMINCSRLRFDCSVCLASAVVASLSGLHCHTEACSCL